MNIETLSDPKLLENTKCLVKREREIVSEVLLHLKEIERRRLFSSLNYKSMFEYATLELGYSEAQAYRRINAARLLKQLPQIEPKIKEGSLSLSNIAAVTQLFRAEAKAGHMWSPSQKLEILSATEHKTRKEAEALIRNFSSIPAPLRTSEKIRSFASHVEIRFSANPEVEDKIKEAKGLMAHSRPMITTADLFETLLDNYIQQHFKTHIHRQTQNSDRNSSASNLHLSQAIRRLVWTRAKRKCEKCLSRHALQIDHIIPRAKGGLDTAENLRLPCRSCNQRAAIEEFGLKKMDPFLNHIRNTDPT